MATYRSFIAVDIPDHIIEGIGIFRKSLKEDIPPIVHWTNPENIHLTLKFLGEIESEMVQRVGTALDNIVQDYKPFGLEPEGIGVFPNWRNPRIIWVGFKKSESLLSLVKQIELYMVNLGCQKEDKHFSPHLTIGRVRDYAMREDIQNLEIKCRTFTKINVITQITEIHLFKSDLYRSGPVYSMIHTSQFQASQ